MGRFVISPMAGRLGVTPQRMMLKCMLGVVGATARIWAVPGQLAGAGFALVGFLLGPLFPTAMAVVPGPAGPDVDRGAQRRLGRRRRGPALARRGARRSGDGRQCPGAAGRAAVARRSLIHRRGGGRRGSTGSGRRRPATRRCGRARPWMTVRVSRPGTAGSSVARKRIRPPVSSGADPKYTVNRPGRARSAAVPGTSPRAATSLAGPGAAARTVGMLTAPRPPARG